MPVSNPSAFPPPRSPDQIISINAGLNFTGQRAFLEGAGTGNNSSLNDLVLLGHGVMGLGVTDVNLAGSTAVGSEALGALISSGTGGPGANTVLGFKAGGGMQYGAANVFIGDNAAGTTPGVFGGTVIQNVVIGSGAAQFAGGVGSENSRLQGVVIIGYAAAQSTAGGGEIAESVIIGAGAAALAVVSGASNIGASVIIGANAVPNIAGAAPANSVVIIGCNCASGAAAQTSVFIGQGVSVGNATAQSVVIGDSAHDTGSLCNVAIGDHVTTLGGQFNVVLGSNADRGVPTPLNNALVIGVCEAQGSNPARRLIVGDFGAQGGTLGGNLILGGSVVGVNDDMQGQNTVKLVDGAKGGNPVGGGYFYVVGGALHWVSSTGIDTLLAP